MKEDLSLFIAAWVTPRDPEIEKLVHTAAFDVLFQHMWEKLVKI